ncbi:thiamine ABC transporter ATP-binding protein [Dongia sp.]|uniref:thiamine ABC transporter ATP-binding protein n=1 Tax=Dongia sp. TaxID=1977262 RepID=UPI0035B3D6C0
MSYIEVTGLEFTYEDLLMHFDLGVEQGDVMAVIGPSGAGKSTLLALIGGFETAQTGRIAVAGVDITDLAPDARPVTTLFQDHNLFAHLSVVQNVGLGLHPGLRLNAAEKDAVAWALSEVGLSGFEDRLPGQLSGGERQRVAIARCILRKRPVLMLDEAFAALGPALRREMLNLVLSLKDQNGLTVLMVTHDPADAAFAADHTAFIAAGKVAVSGPTAEVLASRHPAIRDYLGT